MQATFKFPNGKRGQNIYTVFQYKTIPLLLNYCSLLSQWIKWIFMLSQIHRPYIMMHTAYKTSYFCMQIHVCMSFLVPYNASMYRFLWHFFCTLYMKWFVCIPKTNQGGPFVFGLHTNVHVQIFLVHRFPCKTGWYSS